MPDIRYIWYIKSLMIYAKTLGGISSEPQHIAGILCKSHIESTVNGEALCEELTNSTISNATSSVFYTASQRYTR